MNLEQKIVAIGLRISKCGTMYEFEALLAQMTALVRQRLAQEKTQEINQKFAARAARSKARTGKF